MKAKLYYHNDDFYITVKDVEWQLDFEAKGTWYHEDGCMYRRNGDPGDPPYDETEIEEINILSAMINGVETKPTKELETALEEWCEDNIDVFEEQYYDYSDYED